MVIAHPIGEAILFFALIINKQKLIIKIVVKIQDHIW